MHQVYDDEMTFKLVAAASTVSGLPVEICLEEFGKHFLVYCQKNGYDQILRVLGSNLYDFLTNLDNLHDHLASIYPGMRAPSFRVTRHMNTNRQQFVANSAEQVSLDNSATIKQNWTDGCDVMHKENASCSMAGSMYLHYYSERAGLSPIVKGLVMAVAKEFFQTDILVTECKQQADLKQDLKLHHNAIDDHVLLKIDRKSVPMTDRKPESPSSKTEQQRAPAPAQEPESFVSEQEPESRQDRGQLIESKSMLNIYDSLSTNARDSLVNSDVMMQTFPFNVIFDRQFNLVQVGKSLLRVTSLYWKRRLAAAEHQKAEGACEAQKQATEVKFSDLFDIVRPKIEFTFDAIADHTNQVFVVKTRPLVLNADFGRLKRLSSGSGPATAPPQASPEAPARPMCPMDRIAAMRRRHCSTNQDEQPEQEVPKQPEQEPAGEQSESPQNQLGLRLKGQMIVLLGGELCLYLCSPRVDHLDQLMECGVKMSDFAIHDRARELMLMSHTHKEDREAVKKLDQASNDLKKMDTKLRLENKRTNEVLHNIFPAKIASLLSHGHKVESESFDLVTCLYSDIIGFTKMCGSENVKPIDIVRLLNTLYLQFDNLTNIHGVFKVETIGDAYVVVGGLPEPVEDHADRCVKMGLDMVKVIATVRSPADGNPIQMRIGIHSGPVMAGIVGIRVPRYSLFGNTTTLANQLETHGIGGKIHISDFTLKFVIEDNKAEIATIPFVTYFVTNYLGDEKETLKHEKILEEQLIKDFELMGNRLELVDESHQLRLNKSVDSAFSSIGPQANPNCDFDSELGSALVDAQEPRQFGRAPDAPLAGGHRALAESITNSDEEQYEKLILMDIEDQKKAPARKKLLAELRQISNLLSGTIILEAIKQVENLAIELEVGAKQNQRDLDLAALAMLVGKQTDLELHFRLKQASEDEQFSMKSKNELKNGGCPLCLGSGSLDKSNVILVKFAHANVPANDNQRLLTVSNNRSREEEPNRGATNKCGLASQLSSGSESASTAASKLHLQTTTSYLNHFDNSTEMRDEIWAKAQICKLLEWLVNRQEDPHCESSQIGSPFNEPGDASSPARPRPRSQNSKSGSGHPISSSIQRMKRMDTLKRHKLKKNEQLRAQVNSTASIGAVCLQTTQQQSNQSSKRIAIAEETEEEDNGEDEEEEEEEEEESGLSEFDALVEVASQQQSRGEIDLEGAWRAELARPPDKAQAAPASGQDKRKGSNYSYQSLRFSLTSLLAEMSQPSGKKRFSFNPFANLSFTSPFSSPLKRAATPNQRSRGGPSGFGNVSNQQQTRKHSPRSQSHSSGSAGTTSAASPKQTHNSSARESTCSCLKSSGSSFSIGNSMTR